jgi:hypothetical protein
VPVETLYLDTFTSGAPEDYTVHAPDLSLVPSGILGAVGAALITGGQFVPQSQSDFKDPGYSVQSYNTDVEVDLEVVFGGGGNGLLIPVRFDGGTFSGYLLALTSTLRVWFRFDAGVPTQISSQAHSGVVGPVDNVNISIVGDFATLRINGVLNGQTNVALYDTPGIHTTVGVQVTGQAPAPYTYNGWALDRFEVIGDSDLIPPPPTPPNDGTIADSKLKLGPNKFGTVPRAVPNRSALEIGLGR